MAGFGKRTEDPRAHGGAASAPPTAQEPQVDRRRLYGILAGVALAGLFVIININMLKASERYRDEHFFDAPPGAKPDCSFPQTLSTEERAQCQE